MSYQARGATNPCRPGAAPRVSALRSFSLIEVIIAVGLFAGSVTVIIALLPALTRQSRTSVESLAAQGLADALETELARLAFAGFDALAAQIPVMSAASLDGLTFVADRDATRLQSRDYLPPSSGLLTESEQYFLIECWRFPAEPLRFDATKGMLALSVRVSWPHHLPGLTTPVARSAQTNIRFTVAINR